MIKFIFGIVGMAGFFSFLALVGVTLLNAAFEVAYGDTKK